MNVFVTGHRGYIGAHLVELLKQEGHKVTGCDIDLYRGCEWEEFVQPDVELIQDVRRVEERDLENIDCVMHLAALSNDPMGDLDESLTYAINQDGSIRLANIAKAAGVERFLFSSSCSIYGKGEKLDLEEQDPTAPLTAYAHSKITSENEILKLANNSFSPSFLRNATAFGHSPMLRIDLVVNNLLGCAIANNNIQIKSDGSPWRPLIHCKDIARAFIAFLHAPRELVHNQIVNIGSNSDNYQVKDVADLVSEFVPDAEIIFTGEVGEDPRNYRVNFDKLSNLLPNFKLEYDLSSGMRELYEKYIEHGFNAEDFTGDKYTRIKTLANRMELIR